MLFLELHMLEASTNTFQPITINAEYAIQIHAFQSLSPPMMGTIIMMPTGKMVFKNKYEDVLAALASHDGSDVLIRVKLPDDESKILK